MDVVGGEAVVDAVKREHGVIWCERTGLED